MLWLCLSQLGTRFLPTSLLRAFPCQIFSAPNGFHHCTGAWTMLDVIKPFTAVTYGRKLCHQCYKTCLRPYFMPTEPSSGVITRVKSRHWQWRNISYDRKRLHNIQQAQLLITSNYYQHSTPKDRSTKRAAARN